MVIGNTLLLCIVAAGLGTLARYLIMQVLHMMPLCADCNLSKHDSDPHKWLVRRFGKRKASNIEQRVQQFFDTLK